MYYFTYTQLAPIMNDTEPLFYLVFMVWCLSKGTVLQSCFIVLGILG